MARTLLAYFCVCLFLCGSYATNDLYGSEPDVIARCPKRVHNWKRIFGNHRCGRRCKHGRCRDTRTVCVCDGECGPTCVKPLQKCGGPIEIPNSLDIIVTHQSNPPYFTFADRIKYQCRSGYDLNGPEYRVCRGDGEWTGHIPMCKLSATCGPPPAIQHAEHSSSGRYEFQIDSMVKYRCEPGYYDMLKVSMPIGKCIQTGDSVKWWGPTLKCGARRCVFPDDPKNGERLGDKNLYSDTVSFRCHPGFYLVGSSTRHCQADGSWDGHDPVCKPKACGQPENPVHGLVMMGSDLNYRSRVSYKCDDGYRLIGEPERICQPDETWSGIAPHCEEVRCPVLGNLYNGAIRQGGQVATAVHTTVYFKCDSGTTFVGDHHFATCGVNGEWSAPLPKCLSKCEIPRVTHGSVVKRRSGELVLDGERIELQCEKQYEPSYSEFPRCDNGTWAQPVSCREISCKEWPPNIKNGIVYFDKTEHNHDAVYRCNSGFRLDGDRILKCIHGTWTGKVPNCQPSTCKNAHDQFGGLQNGKILLEGQMGIYEFTSFILHIKEGRRIIYECNKGYVLRGPPKATCVSGTWLPQTSPRCIERLHPEMEGVIIWESDAGTGLRQGATSNDSRRRRSHRRRHRSHRRRHNSLTDEDQLQDLIDRYRSMIFEEHCLLPHRSDATYLTHRVAVNAGELLPHASTALLLCDSKHYVQGRAETECSFGMLQPEPGFCMPKNCTLPALRHGQYTSTTSPTFVHHSDRVAFFCFDDRMQHRVHCEYGQLLPEPPTCTERGLTVYPEGTVIQRLCGDIAGDTTLRCDSGNWRPFHVIECVHAIVRSPAATHATTCPPPRLNHYMVVTTQRSGIQNDGIGGYPLNAQLEITCAYSRRHSWWIRCDRGLWTNLQTPCGPLASSGHTCPINASITQLTHVVTFDHANSMQLYGSSLLAQEIAENAELTFRCEHPGLYKLTGSYKLKCRRGKLNGIVPSCQPLFEATGSIRTSPGITYWIESGTSTVGQHGQIIVSETADVHLDCWFPGDEQRVPTWEASSTFRRYPSFRFNSSSAPVSYINSIDNIVGAVSPKSMFRLSILRALPEDSGTFHCVAPSGQRHFVSLLVKNIVCSPPPRVPVLSAADYIGPFPLGRELRYKCPRGQRAIGPQATTCLEDGRWSGDFRAMCLEIHCPALHAKDPSIHASVSSLRVSSTASFSCDAGTELVGASIITCLENGHWSNELPACKVV